MYPRDSVVKGTTHQDLALGMSVLNGEVRLETAEETEKEPPEEKKQDRGHAES